MISLAWTPFLVCSLSTFYQILAIWNCAYHFSTSKDLKGAEYVLCMQEPQVHLWHCIVPPPPGSFVALCSPPSTCGSEHFTASVHTVGVTHKQKEMSKLKNKTT